MNLKEVSYLFCSVDSGLGLCMRYSFILQLDLQKTKPLNRALESISALWMQ